MNMDMKSLSSLIKVVEEEQRNRKHYEKIYGAITKPLPKNIINNLDETSESSDDNCSKKLNKPPPEKGEKYEFQKMSGLNRKVKNEEVAGAEGSRNRGAIPKNYHQLRNQKEKNDGQSHGSQRRDTSCESSRSFGHDQKNRLPMRRERRNQESDSNQRIHGRDDNYNVRDRFPFYYKVPENPIKANLLSPGVYLVIPQSTVNFLPLKTYYHPSEDSLGKFKRREKCGAYNQNARWRNRRNFQEGKEKEESKKDPPENADRKAQKEECERGPSSDAPSNNFPAEKDVREIFEITLPFYDLDGLVCEFHERNKDVNEFIAEMIQRRRNEIQDKIFEEFPDTDVELLEELVEDAMENFENIEDFIESTRIKRRNKILESLGREMPQIDPNLIKDLYDQYQGSGDIKNIIMKRIEAKREEKMAMEINEIYSILPDADPEFVSKLLSENMDTGNAEKLNDLLFVLLETNNYPKVEGSDEKFREKMKLWRYYISNFTIEKFLERVPEPEITFSDIGARADVKGNEKAAVKFLQMRYPVLKENLIRSVLATFGGSISGTCLRLDKFGPFSSNIGSELLKEDFNELFLQEISYCSHRKEILEMIRVEKERRELEAEECKQEKGFFECSTCFDDEVLPSDVVACPDGHLSCKICLARYIETSYGSGKTEFICLSDSCNKEYVLDSLKKILRHNLFLKITERRAELEVEKAGISGLEKCPSCHYAYIPDPEDKVFKCENFDCLRVTCRLCKETSHLPLSCREVERPRDVNARKRVEEAMSNKLVRRCPGCKKAFIKVDGCNKMHCSCGTMSCYECSAIIRDYSHFNNSILVFGKCPLYTNNDLQEEEVRRAGNEEKEAILREDPNVKFFQDPTKDF